MSDGLNFALLSKMSTKTISALSLLVKGKETNSRLLKVLTS